MKHIQLSKLVSLLALTACMGAHAQGVSGQGTWETTLLARDLNGDSIVDAYYDTVLNISWLADANPAGRMDWAEANTWAQNLDVYGVTGWELPSTPINGWGTCSYSPAGGYDCGYRPRTTSAMAHMYYVTLGNSGYPTTGYGLTNTGPFRNLQSAAYWSSTPTPAGGTVSAWDFHMGEGALNYVRANYEIFAWATHAGDVGTMVSPVPEPATAALMLAGLGAVGLKRRRKQQAQG